MPYTPEVKPIPVIFRADRRKHPDITAVFPTEPASTLHPDLMVCYAHVGQHGSCSLEWYMHTRPAKPEEYAALKAELENQVGYKLRVCQRITAGHRATFRAARAN